MSDVLPPPPPPRSSDGCWKWGALTCGIGCSLAVIAVVVGGFLFMRSPIVKNVMQSMEEAQGATTEIKVVWNALERYHKEKGKYPDKLSALIPNYVTSESGLHYSKNPNGPAFTYHKPAPDSDDSVIVLEYKVSMNIPTGPGQPAPTVNITIRKDGQVMSQTGSKYQGGTGGSGFPSPPGTGSSY